MAVTSETTVLDKDLAPGVANKEPLVERGRLQLNTTALGNVKVRLTFCVSML
jgi:hypothetical protein